MELLEILSCRTATSARPFEALAAYPQLRREILAQLRRVSAELAGRGLLSDGRAVGIASLSVLAHVRLRAMCTVLYGEAHSPITGPHPLEAEIEAGDLALMILDACEHHEYFRRALASAGPARPLSEAEADAAFEALFDFIPDDAHPVTLAMDDVARATACLGLAVPLPPPWPPECSTPRHCEERSDVAISPMFPDPATKRRVTASHSSECSTWNIQ